MGQWGTAWGEGTEVGQTQSCVLPGRNSYFHLKEQKVKVKEPRGVPGPAWTELL